MLCAHPIRSNVRIALPCLMLLAGACGHGRLLGKILPRVLLLEKGNSPLCRAASRIKLMGGLRCAPLRTDDLLPAPPPLPYTRRRFHSPLWRTRHENSLVTARGSRHG